MALMSQAAAGPGAARRLHVKPFPPVRPLESVLIKCMLSTSWLECFDDCHGGPLDESIRSGPNTAGRSKGWGGGDDVLQPLCR